MESPITLTLALLIAHETTDTLMAVFAGLGLLVALIVPYMMRSDAKTAMARTAGVIETTLGNHGERLGKVEETVQEHDREIWALKGSRTVR